jgi:sugar lactone lactonase YvrE
LGLTARAQNIITTVAGGGANSSVATSAVILVPSSVDVDTSGNVFIASVYMYQVFKVDNAGNIKVVAGNGADGYSGDGGAATSAELSYPMGVAIDTSGDLFIADFDNERIRRVDAATGIITTVAGNGTQGFSGDGGPATSATLNHPWGVAVDASGNLFIADVYNQRIRRVDASTGTITTVAGNGTAAYSGDGGAATSASLNYPYGVAVDASGNLFIADTGNARVRRVDAKTGIITTVAGDGNGAYSSGDGGPATSAGLSPSGVALDSSGNLFIADGNNRIRRVDAVTGVITTVAGNGTQGFSGDGGPATNASLNGAESVAVDSSGNLFIADRENQRVRRVAAATAVIATVAGGGSDGDGGPATSAFLTNTYGVAEDKSRSLFIADTQNSRIRRVDATTGIITTVAGNGTYGDSGDGGAATNASLDYPEGVAVDMAGNLFIADYGNFVVRRVDGVSGVITTVAGSGNYGYSGDGGPATSASLENPTDVAVDEWGNLFIADVYNQRVRRVDASTGIITTVAGNGTPGYSGDGGPATSASLYHPSGVAVDAYGNLFIADSLNYVVRRVDAVSGVITTVAGNGTFGFTGDGGPATSASLSSPLGVALDSSGNIFIADANNSRIRRVDAATGIITTVAGNGGYGFTGDGGPATSASLWDPSAVAVDSSGRLSIADTYNNRIRQVIFAPTWQQVPGSLSQVSVGSDGTVWGLNSAGQIYMFNPQTQTWQQAPGLLTQIAVGANGSIWGLNAAGQIYRYDPSTQSWDEIPGALSQIAVGADGDVWGINSSAQVYHFNAASETWTQIPGALAQIAVGYDGAVWGISPTQQIYRFNPGTQGWQQIPGSLKQIAVGADGDVWGINNAGQIYHFNTLTQRWHNTPGSLAQIAVGSASNVWGLDATGSIWCFNAQTQAWDQIPGQLAQIAAGANGAVWGVNSANQIYQFVQPTEPMHTFHQVAGPLVQISAGLGGEVWGIDATQQIWCYDAQLQSFEQIPGTLSEIRVGFGGNVWGLNAAGQIYQFNPSTKSWNQIPGSLAQLAVGADGTVWGLNAAGQIYQFNSSTQGWEQIPGSLAQLAVGADGTVWGLNSVGQIYRFNPATQGWVQIPGSLAQIAVGSANNVWGLNAAGQIYQFNSSTQTWNQIPGSLAQLAVAFDGTVWGLNSANQIWHFKAQTQSWNSIPGLLSQVSVGADAVVWGLNASGQAYQYW